MLPALRAGARHFQVTLLFSCLAGPLFAADPLLPELRAGRFSAPKAAKACTADATSAGCWLLGKKDAPLATALVQGPTDRSATRFSVLLPNDTAGELFVVPPKGPVRALKTTATSLEKGVLLNAAHDGLKPRVDYRLLVFSGDGRFLDGRTFRALDDSAVPLRFGVLSCIDDAFDGPGMWADLRAKKPHFLLFLGDVVYADRGADGSKLSEGADPATLDRRHRETREKVAFYRWPELVPVFATWDDHDFGKGDGDAGFTHRDASERIFRAWFARTKPELRSVEEGPGLAFRFDVGPQRFVLLDDRSFRTKEEHLGPEQEAWAIAAVRTAPNGVWLADGDQYFGAYHRFDSFEGTHPEAFARLLAKLRELPKPVFFLSGDRHLVEYMAIDEATLGYATHELTSSAIHARTYPQAWLTSNNPRKLEGASGIWNYAVVEAQALKGLPTLVGSAAAFGPNDQTLFRRDFKVVGRK